jgi:integrase
MFAIPDCELKIELATVAIVTEEYLPAQPYLDLIPWDCRTQLFPKRGGFLQARRAPMIFQRGQTYWYKFTWSIRQRDGSSESFLIRRSARTKIAAEAEEVEQEHRRAIRLGEVHPLDPWPKPPTPEAPLLRDFSPRFLEYARLHVKESSFAFYAAAVARLLAFSDLANAQISKIRPEVIARFAGARRAGGVGASAINGDLRTLRRLLRLAFEWELIPKPPVVHALPGERTRDRVISFEEEQNYLDAAGANLQALTILAVDTGMRPNSELFRLEWPQVQLETSEFMLNGYIRVREGKTQSAERILPLTPRAREKLLILRREPRRKRWVFPGPGNSGHLISIQKSHRRAIGKSGLDKFPFYCWRHTFGTRCAESGMDRHTLAKLMGHSSPRITEKYYIHVGEPHISSGFERFMAYQAKRLGHGQPATSEQ